MAAKRRACITGGALLRQQVTRMRLIRTLNSDYRIGTAAARHAGRMGGAQLRRSQTQMQSHRPSTRAHATGCCRTYASASSTSGCCR